MKKNWQSILTVIMAILLIVCLIQINSLTDRVNQLNTNFTSQINIVRDSINNISWSVNDSLEQQASILSDAVWEYGKIDLEKRTAEVEVTITPKEYDTNTHAYVSAGTQSFPLTLNNGSFAALWNYRCFRKRIWIRCALSRVTTLGPKSSIGTLHRWTKLCPRFMPIYHSTIDKQRSRTVNARLIWTEI